ncbi:MAG: lipoate--protein ligase family protein [Betaproteobacteria bacterium]|nr:lipoate--protein ligase family protein [Betaproteobacteria bacterium]
MTMGRQPIALVDSGLLPGPENLAVDREGLRRHAQGTYPDLLRMYRSKPTACVGRHQAIDRELRLPYCKRHRIAIARRITGGGALYLDERQLGISLLIARPRESTPFTAERALAQFCRAIMAGLRTLGVESQFAPPNDIEIDGRKLASAFLAVEDGSLLLQGFVLLDVDMRRILETLRVPTEKLSPNGLASARERLVTLSQLLGGPQDASEVGRALATGIARVFNRDLQPGAADDLAPATVPSDDEAFSLAIDWREAGWSEGIWRTAGGVLRARVRYDPDADLPEAVEFASDQHIVPADLLTTIADVLQSTDITHAPDVVRNLYATSAAETPDISHDDVVHVFELAVEKARMAHACGVNPERLMLYCPDRETSARTIFNKASALLVPYCAKPAWCKFREHEECPGCGMCTVSEAYRLARERNLRPITILNYEHLVSTLRRIKADGAQAYLGMCCTYFFVKRQRAFQEAGLPALLMDIAGTTCYELKEEAAAYAGTFKAQTQVDRRVLRQVMRFFPRVPNADCRPARRKKTAAH